MKWNTKYNNWKVGNGCSLVPGLYFITMGTKSIPLFFMHGHFQSCYGILIKYSENQGEYSNLKGSGYFLGCQGNIAWEDWKISQSIFSWMVFQAAVCSGMGINPQFYGIVLILLWAEVCTHNDLSWTRLWAGGATPAGRGCGLSGADMIWAGSCVPRVPQGLHLGWQWSFEALGAVSTSRGITTQLGLTELPGGLHSMPWDCTFPDPKLCP